MRNCLNLTKALLIMVLGLLQFSCSDDNNEPDSPVPPTADVDVTEVQRASVSFTIKSSDATDFAYIIAEHDADAPASAEVIFETGTTGILENGSVAVVSNEVEGGKSYVVYAAVRKINPYVYSEISITDFNTDIPYTSMITLNRVGINDFAFHIEKPQGAEKLKELVVRKNDYEAVKAILGALADVTPEMYLDTFGNIITDSFDGDYDKFGANAAGDSYDLHIHSATTFMVMAAVLDENGKVDKDRFQCVEFDTRKADTTPYDLDVDIKTTSTSASVTITPEEGITDYRAIVVTKADFDYSAREGESQVRFLIIGHWDDSTNPQRRAYTGQQKLEGNGLIPGTQYMVGIVGFDAEGREILKTIEFITGEPTGPAPTLTVVESTPSDGSSWNSAAYNVKADNAVEIKYGFWLKSQVDEVLDRGSSMEDIIAANGNSCTADQVAAALSADGLTFEAGNLNPETEYLFGVYARTEEYVTAVEHRVFTTDGMPQVGGDVRKNMPGKYMARTTDENGDEVTFPVTITTGVNDATTASYASVNRLVALGFGPADKFPCLLPSEITADDPDTAYGPKWFIEFTEEGIKVPNAGGKSWTMGMIDGAATYMRGFGIRETANGPREMQFDDDFEVTVSEDGNVITVKGTFHDIGNGGTCYPAMYTPGSGWFSPDTYHFKSCSDIILTRVETTAAAAGLSPVIMPESTVINVLKSNATALDREAYRKL